MNLYTNIDKNIQDNTPVPNTKFKVFEEGSGILYQAVKEILKIKRMNLKT